MDREQANYVKAIRERLSPYTEPGPSLSALETRVRESFFLHVAPYVKQILHMFELLKETALEEIPVTRLKQILGRVDSANNELNAIKNYGPGAPPPTDLTGRILSVLDGLYADVVTDIVKANVLGQRARLEATEISALNAAKEAVPEIAKTGQLDKWTHLKNLDSGGQGSVSVVFESGKDPIDSIIEPLTYLIKGIKSPELLEECRKRFRDALSDYVGGKTRFGALKLLRVPDDQARARLKVEAEVYEAISDPHLLKILDKNVTDGWIVTEYQPNGTLEHKLEEYKGQVLKTLTAIRPVVNVLAQMHSRGFTHRDVKPANIFISRSSELVLGDAGLAFYDRGERLTRKHENVGTRDYMPPWVQSRRAEIQNSFDVFAIGKVIHAMISGAPAPAAWYIHEDYSELTALFPNDPTMHWANDVLDRCIGKNEDEILFRDSQDLVHHLDTIIENMKRGTIPATLIKHAQRRCRVCGMGHYTRLQRISLGNDSRGQPVAVANQCNECGHVEFFSAQLPQ